MDFIEHLYPLYLVPGYATSKQTYSGSPCSSNHQSGDIRFESAVEIGQSSDGGAHSKYRLCHSPQILQRAFFDHLNHQALDIIFTQDTSRWATWASCCFITIVQCLTHSISPLRRKAAVILTKMLPKIWSEPTILNSSIQVCIVHDSKLHVKFLINISGFLEGSCCKIH